MQTVRLRYVLRYQARTWNGLVVWFLFRKRKFNSSTRNSRREVLFRHRQWWRRIRIAKAGPNGPTKIETKPSFFSFVESVHLSIPTQVKIPTNDKQTQVVRQLLQAFFTSKLVQHFDIMWLRNKIAWPCRFKTPAVPRDCPVKCANSQQDHTSLEIHKSDRNTKHKQRQTPELVTAFGPTV